jgi:hypothetical protein
LGFAVTYRADDDEDFDDTPDEKPKGRVLVRIVVVVMLAAAGSGSALLRRAYGTGLPVFPSFTSAAANTPVAVTTVPVADKPVGLADLQAFQQQFAGAMQSTEKLLTAQQAEIKRLSDQVSVLSAKLDLLQRPIASAQAALPVPASPKPVAPAPRKKPAAVAHSVGAISLGGAPLPPPVPSTR